MTIKAVFPIGKDTATAQGLFQWDYGQILEIECAEFGYEIMEVHFACPNMKVAIPRPCTFTNGMGTVPIPDECLEQENAITAWICRIDDTQSHTVKTITLPITKRTRPIQTREIPTEIVDKYGELVVEVAETVDALKEGNITVAKATHAESANKANTASHAEYAERANTAESANNANYTEAAGTMELRLVALSTVTAGEGTGSVTLTANTPYFLVYESNLGYVSSGIIMLSSSTGLGLCPLKQAYAFRVYAKSKGFETAILEYSITNTTNPSSPVTKENGTAYIYSFGHISA